VDKEVIQGLLGPVLTAVVTGLGVVLRQAWQARDERQRASRQLREAAQQVEFISTWVSAQDQLSTEEERAAGRARARRDLEAIYDTAVSSMARSKDVLEKSAGWDWARVLNAVVALRVSRRPDRSAAGDNRSPAHPTYRRPLGLARVLRPFYWLLLAWSGVWTAACFATLPAEGEGFAAVCGWVAVALLLMIVGGVLPAAAWRALVLYVDEVVAERRQREADVPSPVGGGTAQPPRLDIPGNAPRVPSQGLPSHPSPSGYDSEASR